MTPPDSKTPSSPPRAGRGAEPPAPPNPPRPWRTEGLPPGQPPKPKRRWNTIVIGLLGYLAVFGVLTLQDRLSNQQVAVPYTELKSQVGKKNVTGVFSRGDSIEGELKSPAPVPGQAARTYKQFTTERPTFARDDLLAELMAGGATVRATPLVPQRGFLANLLISFAPTLLFFGFWIWMLRRQ